MVWSCFFLNLSRCGLRTRVFSFQGDRLWPLWLVLDFNWEVLEKVPMGDAAFDQKLVS